MPQPEVQDHPPIIKDCEFIQNTNLNEFGAGVLSVLSGQHYENHHLTLTVENWLFESNESDNASAIRWDGVNMYL